jgi:uncharacterized protein with von Willebrand factor type A (vWA) domain
MTKNSVYILLDKSGSMLPIWERTISSVNEYVADLSGTEDVSVYVAAFDTAGYVVLRNVAISAWEPISSTEVTPGGGTPLLDAAGRIMWSMYDSGAKNAILVILTDGEENSSSKFKASEVKNMLRDLTTRMNYDVVFLGANFDGIGDVATNSFDWVDQSRVVSASSAKLNATMAHAAGATRAYFSTGEKAAEMYSDADKWAARS